MPEARRRHAPARARSARAEALSRFYSLSSENYTTTRAPEAALGAAAAARARGGGVAPAAAVEPAAARAGRRKQRVRACGGFGGVGAVRYSGSSALVPTPAPARARLVLPQPVGGSLFGGAVVLALGGMRERSRALQPRVRVQERGCGTIARREPTCVSPRKSQGGRDGARPAGLLQRAL